MTVTAVAEDTGPASVRLFVPLTRNPDATGAALLAVLLENEEESQ